jgi:glucose-1-phosphate adenylyltransferase
VEICIGDEAPSKLDSRIYNSGLTTIGENTVIPNGVKIGKNIAISGKTTPEDYPDGYLQSGEYIIKAGDAR